jgi:glyoxylase-like metal-dependent hydrolase (beta-lactamase superfamily II)
VPVIVGPGELDGRSAENAVMRSTYRGLLADHRLEALDPARATALDGFDAAWDLVGDGSLWAVWVPGHTAGSLAFLARTTEGPVLLTGDTSHTRWGWDHGVTPGRYTADLEGNARSLAALRAFATEHAGTRVIVGHETEGADAVAQR